jgi:hypothetical protein
MYIICNERMYRQDIISRPKKQRPKTPDVVFKIFVSKLDGSHGQRHRDAAGRLCINNSCQHVSTGRMQVFNGVIHLSVSGGVRCCLGQVLAGRLRGRCLEIAHSFDVYYKEGAFSSSLQSGSH